MARRRHEDEFAALRFDEDVPKEYKDGFGWKAILGGLFVAFFIVPASMFLSLVVGETLGAAAVWVTIVLFIEISKRVRTKLEVQEIYILFVVAGGILGLGQGLFGNAFIHMQYLVRSPAAKLFEIADRIPHWVAPPPDSEAYAQRSLLHSDWWPRLALMGVTLIWGRLNFYSLGYVFFRLTSDVERLPFPLAPIAAQGVTALAESTTPEGSWRWTIFTTGSTIGIAFGTIYVMVPTVTDAVFGARAEIIPIPFIDFTEQTQRWLPAVPVSMSTNLGLVFAGFVLPFWMIVGSAMAGIIGRLILNPILYHVGILQKWEPGMNVLETGIANNLDFWLSFSIGSALGVALVGIITAIARLRQAARKVGGSQREARKLLAPPKGRGDIPIPLAITLYIVSTTGTIIVAHILVPSFPLWILLGFAFLYTPIMSYVSARMVGLTGHGLGIPHIREAAFVLSGYRGVAIWFAPIPLGQVGAGPQGFRQAELTGTKISSIFKASLFEIPLAVVASLLFWSIIWKMGDIPAASYPYAFKFWPIRAILQFFWITATTAENDFFLKTINFTYMGWGLGFCLISFTILSAFRLPTLLLFGFIRGGMLANPFDVGLELIAACFGRFYFARKYGAKTWRRYTPVLAAGYGCGVGLIAMVSVAILLLTKAVSHLPF